MMRGLVERLLNPEQMDQWFEQLAQEQYTRELLFSTVVSLLLEVVCGSRKAVTAAYQAMAEAIPVSIQAVYDKLQGVEPAVAAELVRYTAREGQAIMAAVEAAALRAPLETALAEGLPAVPWAEAVRAGAAVKAGVKAGRPAVLPGYPVRILDGNHVAATDHRLKALRT
jgi:hypothetical protein